MYKLTLAEEIVLTAILRLQANAYGVTIRKTIAEVTKSDVSYGILYNLLGQLVRKGYVKKKRSQPTRERGGRSRMYYTFTITGLKALEEARELHRSLWDGIPEIITLDS
jgi:PadR family transcriptional regulator PadR